MVVEEKIERKKSPYDLIDISHTFNPYLNATSYPNWFISTAIIIPQSTFKGKNGFGPLGLYNFSTVIGYRF